LRKNLIDQARQTGNNFGFSFDAGFQMTGLYQKFTFTILLAS